ncbi:MAG: nodulation protein NfeD [Dehalococcoidia bacterium]|nr:nodulation protein NfeD [Dehalococcoidia bacterium]
MRKFWLFLISLGLFILLISGEASAATPQVDVLRVKGTINPVVAGYIDRGIGLAEEHGATACIIELNTPGGLASSMQVIVERIINAEVPVVVYVSPGGWAASAGTFIVMSAHIAAMGPGSSIGAATPVAGSGEELPETEEQKALEFFSSYMQTLAEQRGRNVEWAEKAVRESAALTDVEALEQNVIDLRANDIDDLISQLDGWEVMLLSGEVITLETEDADVNYIEMGALERFLFTISDPNIAYILLSIGMLGIMLELFNPGTIFPGVVGAICLLLSFYSLGMLPVNYVGIILIILAFGLFIAEVFITSHGLLALGGIASLTIGSMILMTSPLFQINPGLIAGVVIVVTAFFIFVIGVIVRTRRKPQQTGREAMVGMVAVARTALDPTGTVFVHGERWEATVDEGKVEPGEEVVITKVDGLRLRVTRKNKKGGE